MTILKIACMDCRCDMGEEDGQGVSGTSHSTCPACWRKRFPGKEYPEAPEITYRGWPGHYILCHRCVFHLNTLVELAGIRVVVSTVGNLRNKDNGQDEVGSGRYYETMALPLPPQILIGKLLARLGRTGNYIRAKLNNWVWQPEFMLFRKEEH